MHWLTSHAFRMNVRSGRFHTSWLFHLSSANDKATWTLSYLSDRWSYIWDMS